MPLNKDLCSNMQEQKCRIGLFTVVVNTWSFFFKKSFRK
jgi:hypothetical protein